MKPEPLFMFDPVSIDKIVFKTNLDIKDSTSFYRACACLFQIKLIWIREGAVAKD